MFTDTCLFSRVKQFYMKSHKLIFHLKMLSCVLNVFIQGMHFERTTKKLDDHIDINLDGFPVLTGLIIQTSRFVYL